MKNKLLTLALVALPGLALADFSLDFSSGDYSDGALAGNSDWALWNENGDCLLYTSPSPRDRQKSRMAAWGWKK